MRHYKEGQSGGEPHLRPHTVGGMLMKEVSSVTCRACGDACEMVGFQGVREANDSLAIIAKARMRY